MDVSIRYGTTVCYELMTYMTPSYCSTRSLGEICYFPWHVCRLHVNCYVVSTMVTVKYYGIATVLWVTRLISLICQCKLMTEIVYYPSDCLIFGPGGVIYYRIQGSTQVRNREHD